MRNNQNGIIAIFVLFAMLILLIFTIGIYYSIKEKSKLQTQRNFEYQEIYSKNYQEISNIEYANSNEIVPIYNVDQLNNVGTNNYLQIKNKIYECGREKSYVLKDNIIVDIEEKIKTNTVLFNDYKLFSNTYLIDKASYDLYYYGYNKYWKAIAYKKYEDNNFILNNEVYEDKEFSIINNVSFETNREYEFLILFFYKQGEFIEEKRDMQKIQKNKIYSLNEINVYKNNLKMLEQANEFYLFVSIGNSI